ncbi:hypothetical protein [Acrocarpospora macrocephala]|uniref:hypothetical protein n=1 Tax=Acrocarpospora macrocephala TaxID=150177 RepID=UPI0012D35526|nr:hypothetical protein [Acrocarpospora macrocephala]
MDAFADDVEIVPLVPVPRSHVSEQNAINVHAMKTRLLRLLSAPRLALSLVLSVMGTAARADTDAQLALPESAPMTTATNQAIAPNTREIQGNPGNRIPTIVALQGDDKDVQRHVK